MISHDTYTSAGVQPRNIGLTLCNYSNACHGLLSRTTLDHDSLLSTGVRTKPGLGRSGVDMESTQARCRRDRCLQVQASAPTLLSRLAVVGWAENARRGLSSVSCRRANAPVAPKEGQGVDGPICVCGLWRGWVRAGPRTETLEKSACWSTCAGKSRPMKRGVYRLKAYDQGLAKTRAQQAAKSARCPVLLLPSPLP